MLQGAGTAVGTSAGKAVAMAVWNGCWNGCRVGYVIRRGDCLRDDSKDKCCDTILKFSRRRSAPAAPSRHKETSARSPRRRQAQADGAGSARRAVGDDIASCVTSLSLRVQRTAMAAVRGGAATSRLHLSALEPDTELCAADSLSYCSQFGPGVTGEPEGTAPGEPTPERPPSRPWRAELRPVTTRSNRLGSADSGTVPWEEGMRDKDWIIDPRGISWDHPDGSEQQSRGRQEPQ